MGLDHCYSAFSLSLHEGHCQNQDWLDQGILRMWSRVLHCANTGQFPEEPDQALQFLGFFLG